MNRGGEGEVGASFQGFWRLKPLQQEQGAEVCLMWKLDSLNPSTLIFHKLQAPLGCCSLFL